MTARTLSDGPAAIVRRAQFRTCAFLARHPRLLDDLAAALVGLIAIAAWGAAFALFAH